MRPSISRRSAGPRGDFVTRSARSSRRGADQSRRCREALEASTLATLLPRAWRVEACRGARSRGDQEVRPGVPTRYLFTLARCSSSQGKPGGPHAQPPGILKGRSAPSDPDRTEDKAAAYIRGVALLREARRPRRRRSCRRAVALSGYEYSVYGSPLRGPYLQAGAHAEALASVKEASAPGNPAEPRLDLNLDRVRAGLVEAELERSAGAPRGSAVGGQGVLQPGPVRIQACRMWARPPPGGPAVGSGCRYRGMGVTPPEPAGQRPLACRSSLSYRTARSLLPGVSDWLYVLRSEDRLGFERPW